MTRRRWILLVMLLMVMGLSVVYLVKPNEGLGLLCYVYVVPVVAVNVSALGMIWEGNIGESATHVV